MARRGGVDDPSGTDGRARAQHHVVTARRDDGRIEPKLGEPSRTNHTSEHRRRAVMDEHAWWNRRELLEFDVEPVARVVGAPLDEDVSPSDLTTLDAGEGDGHPLSGLGSLDLTVVHLHASNSHIASLRLDAQHVAAADSPGPERAGCDGADPPQREHAVDVQPRRRVIALGLNSRACKRGPKLVQPLARLCAHRDDLDCGRELVCLRHCELDGLGVDGVGLRDRDDPVLHPEQAQDRQVLVRLWPRAFRRVDHEQEEIDAGGAGDHGANETLVTRHVDEREAAPVGELERRVTEIDRDSAGLLLRQAIRVLARQRPDEPRLAVVDVTGGPDGQRHRRIASATSSISSSASVRQSSSVRPSRTSAITGGSQPRSFAASSSPTAQAKLGSSVSGSAPPPALATVSSTSPSTSSASRVARARTVSGDSRSMRTTGISSGASIATLIVASSAASVSLSARSARWSGWRRSFSTRSARPTTIPACGPPSSLSPEKHTRSAPAARLDRAVGSSPTSTSAPDPRSSTSTSSYRRATCARSSRRGCSVKPTMRKFDWCTRRSTAVSGPIAAS